MAVLTQEIIDSYKQSARFHRWCDKSSERKRNGVSIMEAYLEDITDMKAAIMAAEKLEEMARELRDDARAIERYMEQDRVENENIYMKQGFAKKLLRTGSMTPEEIADCVDLPLSVVQDLASKTNS